MSMNGWDRWCAAHPGVAFMLGNGAFGVIVGTVLLFGDPRVPHGWSCLVIACGAILLVGAVLDVLEIETTVKPETIVAVVVVAALLALTALYFTHPAEDLPRYLSGHDGDSQHLRVWHGAATTVAACFALRVTYRLAAPHRSARS